MGLIRILDSSLKRLAILKHIGTANRFEEINGENKLDFTVVYDEKASAYINENNIIELDGDYFDIVYYQKQQNENGTLAIQVQGEHVSYRLNDETYNLDTFATSGTPTEILTEILDGTPFTVGTVEFTEAVVYSAQEKKSRRQLLMEFIAQLGGEADFDRFAVSILQHRGSTDRKILAKGKNIKVVSKTYNKREKDANGNPLVSYTCTPIQLPDTLSLGDEVLLIQKDLGIQEPLRIVRLGYNPYDNIEADIELANFVSGLEDQIYQIQTQTVTKEKTYNGVKIGPDEGFVAIRSDNKVKSILNATEGIAVKKGNGSGNTWDNRFYVDVDGNVRLTDAYIELVKGVTTISLNPEIGIKIQNNENDVFFVDTDGLLNLVNIIVQHVMKVSSNVWNAGTDHGISFGGDLPAYSPPATIKYTQGLTGDGTSQLEIEALQVNLKALAAYENDKRLATREWVTSQDFATQSWVIGQISATIAAHVAAYHSGP